MRNEEIFNFNKTLLDDLIKKEVDRLVEERFDELKKVLSQTYFFDDSLLSREEVAKKLGVSIGKVDSLKKTKKLKSCNSGRNVKFRNSDVLQYIKSLK